MQNLITRAGEFANRCAVISNGHSFTYQQLLDESAQVASTLLGEQPELNGARVAFMIRPGFNYVRVILGIWRAGGIAVPLSLYSPFPALHYVLEDAQCEYLIADEEFSGLLQPAIDSGNYQYFQTDQLSNQVLGLPKVDPGRSALIIYTSGTTGKPKGVVSTHAIIESQIGTLVEAWQWTESDHILNVLPLHHVHGLVNVLLCALWSGACCEFMRFDAAKTLDRLCEGSINLFMAVPTIYFKLIDYWGSLTEVRQKEVHKALSQFRLMVSGSAALPVSVMEQWEHISGQRLLERYGMTEIGMAISNPYDGERRAGHIGQPLPGVLVKLVDEEWKKVADGESGEILIQGPNVFKAYWQKKEATDEAFTRDGWFKTGDVAVLNQGSYRIMGRSSVDIIKSGGYKISALEIEEVLRTHPAIADCAVVGIPDPQWNEIVAAGIVWETGMALEQGALTDWLKTRLPGYQIPRKFLSLEDLPRNAMGKVTKPALKKLF